MPALALTALADRGRRQRSLAAGFQMHLTKPVDIDAPVRGRARAGAAPAGEPRAWPVGNANADEGGGGDIDVSTATLFAVRLGRRSRRCSAPPPPPRSCGAPCSARAVESPELVELIVRRENLAYRYTLPPAWSHTTTQTAEARAQVAFRALVAEMAGCSPS